MRSHFSYLFILGFCCLTLVLPGIFRPALAQYPGFGDPGASVAGGNPAAGLVPVAPTIDGGAVPSGATAQVVVRFRNDGSQPVQTGLIRLYPSSTVSAQVAMNQCEEEPLPAGAECAIALSVKGLQSGNWRVEMLMSHSGRTRLVTSTISGTVESGAEGAEKLASDIETIPNELDFGSLSSSQTLIEPIILRNITSAPLDITDIYLDTSEQSGYSMKTECETLEAGQACIAVVTWAPKLKGRSSGVLVIKHSGPTALASVPLSGEYTPSDTISATVFPQAVPGRGLLVSSQDQVDFGSGVETASTITVSLVNAGDADLTLKDIKISGSDNGLGFKGEGCAAGTVLQPVEACPLTLTWSPTRVGALFDDVQITHDGARGVLVLPIRGESTSAVSQDQKAIMLSDRAMIMDPGLDLDPEMAAAQARAAAENAGRVQEASFSGQAMSNPASVLDGYKITSFSPTRAIINGPGGSRLVFDNEEVTLGGVPWFITIQKNGIEFLYQGQRVLLLFDRSLSTVNRVSASSGGGGGSSSTTAQ